MAQFWIVAQEPRVEKAREFFLYKVCAENYCSGLHNDRFKVWECEGGVVETKEVGEGKMNKIMISRNFLLSEFQCKCCKQVMVDLDFLFLAQAFREFLGFRFTPNSGYRCEIHNRAMGGAKNSQHRKGKAMDVPMPDGTTESQFESYKSKAISLGFRGVGKYYKGNKPLFLHVDTRSGELKTWTDRDE